jgi:hypothetical protein
MSLATVTGWLAAIAIVAAVLVPVVHRLRTGKRGAPGSQPIRIHVLVGLTTSAIAFAHTLSILPALGSPAAIGGGVLALLPGGAAFFLLVAHAGLGLQLRDPKLRDRAKKRRQHTTTAVLIAAAVATHVVLLERAG